MKHRALFRRLDKISPPTKPEASPVDFPRLAEEGLRVLETVPEGELKDMAGKDWKPVIETVLNKAKSASGFTSFDHYLPTLSEEEQMALAHFIVYLEETGQLNPR